MTRIRPLYGFSTRLFHGTLATAIVVQLASSQVMQVPRETHPGNWAFEVHQYSGMIALALALAFWVVVMTRIGGTDPGAMVPWFSAVRRAAFLRDLKAHWAAARAFRFADYDRSSPFAAAVHGLGLLLMTVMATTGTIYVIAGQIGYQDSPLLHLAMDLHGAAGNLVWAYLIGHAALAAIHHIKRDLSLRDMWSFGPLKDERIPK
jgi:cytochrome b561